MCKKKIICLILSFVLIFGAVPRKTYAEPVTATIATLALALIAAAGVTFVVDAERIENVVNHFLDSNPQHKNFLNDLLKLIPNSSGTGLVLSASIFKTYKSKILDFIRDVIQHFRKPDTITVDNPGFSYLGQNVYDEKFLVEQVQDFDEETGSECHGERVPPFATYIHSYGDYVYFYFYYPYIIDGDGYKIRRTLVKYRKITENYNVVRIKFDSVKHEFPSNAQKFYDVGVTPFIVLQYNVGIGMTYDTIRFNFASENVTNDEIFGEKYVYRGYIDDNERDLLLLNGWAVCEKSTDFVYDDKYTKNMADIYLPVLNDAVSYVPKNLPFVDAVPPVSDIVYPDGVTSDIVIDKWNDALNGTNDIVVTPVSPDTLVGQHGYDVAYGDTERPGIITGVDVPVLPVDKPIAPDVPVPPDVVNPDLTGISGLLTGIKSILQNIFDFVKSLPATIIGDGTIDFSKFENIKFSTVFPFCIPFDLKNAIVSFDVLPREPIWEIDFAGTFMSSAGSFVVDLRRFEKLFEIVRFFAYGGFIISLIILTRKIVK